MRSRVLFVTKAEDERFHDGFVYATGLAKISEGGVFVLFLFDRKGISQFEDEMAAAAMAEQGAFEAAREILTEGNSKLHEAAEEKIRQLQAHGGEHLIVEHRVSTDEVVPAIRAVLQDHPAIEIVIISPSLMDGEKSLSFKKLRRKISRPVVTMSRPASV